MANNLPPDPEADRTHSWVDEAPSDDPPYVVETGVFVCALCGCAVSAAEAKLPCPVGPTGTGGLKKTSCQCLTRGSAMD